MAWIWPSSSASPGRWARWRRLKFSEQVELPALFGAIDLGIADIGEELVDLHVGRDDAGGLEFGGEEAVRP